jgi:acyl-coenzyme A synthetase/AMP-(fatty) acid ligase
MELAFYRWRSGHSESHCQRGVVPIGVPFSDHQHVLLDEQQGEVVDAGIGELYIQGPQVGLGYWADDAQTARSWVSLPRRSGLWYKSGDRVERDTLGDYHFISRVDLMVKVRGHRIELAEVEHALRRASGVDLVAVVPEPVSQGLVGFVCAPCAWDPVALRQRLQPLLPKAMCPDSIHVLDAWPLNANRKVDRAALAQLLLQSHTKERSRHSLQALSS